MIQFSKHGEILRKEMAFLDIVDGKMTWFTIIRRSM